MHEFLSWAMINRALGFSPAKSLISFPLHTFCWLFFVFVFGVFCLGLFRLHSSSKPSSLDMSLSLKIKCIRDCATVDSECMQSILSSEILATILYRADTQLLLQLSQFIRDIKSKSSAQPIPSLTALPTSVTGYIGSFLEPVSYFRWAICDRNHYIALHSPCTLIHLNLQHTFSFVSICSFGLLRILELHSGLPSSMFHLPIRLPYLERFSMSLNVIKFQNSVDLFAIISRCLSGNSIGSLSLCGDESTSFASTQYITISSINQLWHILVKYWSQIESLRVFFQSATLSMNHFWEPHSCCVSASDSPFPHLRHLTLPLIWYPSKQFSSVGLSTNSFLLLSSHSRLVSLTLDIFSQSMCAVLRDTNFPSLRRLILTSIEEERCFIPIVRHLVTHSPKLTHFHCDIRDENGGFCTQIVDYYDIVSILFRTHTIRFWHSCVWEESGQDESWRQLCAIARGIESNQEQSGGRLIIVFPDWLQLRSPNEAERCWVQLRKLITILIQQRYEFILYLGWFGTMLDEDDTIYDVPSNTELKSVLQGLDVHTHHVISDRGEQSLVLFCSTLQFHDVVHRLHNVDMN